jgi:hypothetical protein
VPLGDVSPCLAGWDVWPIRACRPYEDIFWEDFVDDPSVPVVRRAVRDGRTFRVVKVFWEPDDLRSALSELGWQAEVHTAGPLFWAEAIPMD